VRRRRWARRACGLSHGGFGYTDVAVLEGGVKAWEAAGFAIYSGVHVPSKAFAEVVEHEAARRGSRRRS
jgi:3-mercaptopyruvate sulfurtransferase SseA